MKKVIVIAASALIALSASSLVAAGTTRIAVLDMHQIMADAPQVKQIRDSLQKQFKSREDSIVKEQEAFKADAEKLNKDGSVMAKKDKDALQKKVIDEQQSLQAKQMAFQQDVMKAQNASIKGFIDSVKDIVTKIAKKQEYDVVLTKDTIAFVNSKLDITDQVLSDLKDKK